MYAHNKLVSNDKIIGNTLQTFYFCHDFGLVGRGPGRDLQNIFPYLVEPLGIRKAGDKSGGEAQNTELSIDGHPYALPAVFKKIVLASGCGEQFMFRRIADSRLAVENTVYVMGGGDEVMVYALHVRLCGDNVSVRALRKEFLLGEDDM